MNTKKLLSLWGLKWNPFSPELPSEGLWLPPKIDHFAWRVEQLVLEGGFALISGESGTDKSVALRIVAERLVDADLVVHAAVRDVELAAVTGQGDVVRHRKGRIYRFPDDGIGGRVDSKQSILAAAGQVGGVEDLSVGRHSSAMRAGPSMVSRSWRVSGSKIRM